MICSVARAVTVAATLAALLLGPTLVGAAGDPPRPGTGKGSPGPKGQGSDLPSANPGDVKVRPKPDLYVSAMGYSAGQFTFGIVNQGPGNAEQSKWRLSCQLDPNQLAKCAVSFKPSENAGTLQACPGFASLYPVDGVIPALAPGQIYTHTRSQAFKPGCRYKLTLEADAAHQITEVNENNNTNSYIATGQ